MLASLYLYYTYAWLKSQVHYPQVYAYLWYNVLCSVIGVAYCPEFYLYSSGSCYQQCLHKEASVLVDYCLFAQV